MEIEVIKIIISALGFGGTIIALVFGFRQYLRAEQWKRAEFVAKEVKEFESDASVRNAMQMIDWGERRINLFREDGLKYEECILITRADQWRALLPHTIKIHYPSRSVSEEAEKRKRFTSEETAIRDIYDVFLNYLQRFGNFIMTDLVSLKDLKPYLHYWLESIAQGDLDKDEDSIEDLLWRHALLCYINFYNYTTVINLFYEFGFDISPNGEILKKLERKLADESYYEKQLEVVSERQPYLNANIKLISELKRTIQP